MQKKIIMCRTMARAYEEWNQFCYKHKALIKCAKRNPLSITLINGDIWYFRGETQGTPKGYYAEICCVDDFPLDELLGESLVKEN